MCVDETETCASIVFLLGLSSKRGTHTATSRAAQNCSVLPPGPAADIFALARRGGGGAARLEALYLAKELRIGRDELAMKKTDANFVMGGEAGDEATPEDAAPTAGPGGAATRLELIEVPSYVNATAAPDGLEEEAVGLNHLAFDVIEYTGDDDLAAYLKRLNARSEAQFRKSLHLALAPQQLLAGGAAYEYAFIADPDGVLLELVRRRNALGVGPEVEDW